ncbi:MULTISPECIES: LysE family translocator [Thermocrispum]|jgi:threonine/homoserine/homoserine lactone efflux protein|uniref:LysE family translocator n=1 Tax=Thermocrispum agreste TaxID=37925 RepID=A0ABD6FCF1_9PSEU|nr:MULTISPECIES: LysE family translocator [Thermocrispum]
MVSWEQVVAFSALAFVLVATPGPSVMFVVSRALTTGRRQALMTVAGNAAGVYLQVVGVAFGLGALVERSVVAFTVLKVAGAAYLVYLGVQAIRNRRALVAAAAEPPALTPRRALAALRDGVVFGFCNPKSIVFFAAVMPQFVDHTAGNVTQQVLLLGLAVPAIALVLDSTWALAAGTARQWLARSPRRLATVSGSGGAVMIGLGTGLLMTSRS